MAKFIFPALCFTLATSAQASTWGPDADPGYRWDEKLQRYETIGDIHNPQFWVDLERSATTTHNQDQNRKESDLFVKKPTLLEALRFQRKVVGDQGITNIQNSLQETDTHIIWLAPNDLSSKFSHKLLNDLNTLVPSNMTVLKTSDFGNTKFSSSQFSIILLGNENWKETRDLYQRFMTNFDDMTQGQVIKTFKINTTDIPFQTWKQLGASTTIDLWKEASVSSENYLGLIRDILHAKSYLFSYLGDKRKNYEYLTSKEGFKYTQKSLAFL